VAQARALPELSFPYCVHQVFDFSLGARFPFVNPSSLGAAVLRLLQFDAGLFLTYRIKSSSFFGSNCSHVMSF
jgi:hypothetical protein